ncbi:MAG TPA: DUF4232 domain-containing protein [Acidimicrobiales bacterium]
MRLLLDSVRTVTLVALIATMGAMFVPGSLASAGASGMPGPCTTKETVTIGPKVSPASQELAFTLKLTNETSKSCTVESYPTLMFIAPKGQILSFTYSHKATGDYAMTNNKPTILVVKPGHSAFVLIAKPSCVGPDQTRATKVGISVPWTDSSNVKPGTVFRTVKLSPTMYPEIFTCTGRNAKSENTIAFTPLEASFNKTL